MKLVLATRNEHKRREFGRLLPGLELDAPPDGLALPRETGATFAENAREKASAVAHATGQATIADDSGIEADALGGAPGVRSARFAGDGADDRANLEKLLGEAPAGSGLTYVCALAYVAPAGEERLFEARCAGTLAAEPRGERGFGYDPAFVPDREPGGRTMAELADSEKDAISHRGQAARQLLEWLGR